MDLGYEFKKIRKMLKVTQEQLAATLNIDQGYISAIENGKKPVTETVIENLELKYPWVDIGHIKSYLHEAEKNNNQHLFSEERIPYISGKEKGIPMYNIPGSASDIEMYADLNEDTVIGYMNFPGIEDCDFALPVWGQSMSPYLESGCWASCKRITDPTKIIYGEVYYIEWEGYRMFKRLLIGDKEEEVILHSDNTNEMIGNRPKYGQKVIRKDEIRKLYLVKDIHKKINH